MDSARPSSSFEDSASSESPALSHWGFMLGSNPPNKSVVVSLVPVIVLLAWYFVSYQISPLKKYPGPWLAGYTNLWRLGLTYSAEYAPRMQKLHEKHGPVVRIGPNLLDLDFPQLSKVVFGTDGQWHKNDFPKNNSTVIDGQVVYHMFSEVSNVKHAKLKRPVVRHFSIPSVLAMEPVMDEVIEHFCDFLEKRFAKPKQVCRFGDWLSYFAWDFLGLVTFSKEFGYMEAGCDFDGTHALADKTVDYTAYVGQMPWLDFWLVKNPIVRIGPSHMSDVTRIAANSLTARLEARKDPSYHSQKPDYLDLFIESMLKHPDDVDETTIVGYLLLNLLAGADTTTIALRAFFYHSLRNPNIWARLAQDVRAKAPQDRVCPYSVARGIPYLEATVRETLRYHPSVSMALERIVPKNGVALPNGSFVPGGTHVGMNPYILGRNKSIFGEDADDFRPDRWLQREDEDGQAFKERMRLWDTAHLTFGGGSRICLGRHLSGVEMYKTVATLIARFDIELDDPNEVWWTCSRFFYRTKGVICRVKSRVN